MMYCPKCGKQASADQKFCRSCGLNLQLHAQILTGPSPTAESDRALMEMAQRIQSQRRKMLRRGFATLLGGMVVGIFFEVMGGAIANLDRRVGNFIEQLAEIGGLICVVGIGLMIYSFFLPKVSAHLQSPQPTALPQAESPVHLPPERRPEPVPSVTEHTTVKLEAPNFEAPHQMVGESKESS